MPGWSWPIWALMWCVRRPGAVQMPPEEVDLLHRGKRVVDLDVKKEGATDAARSGGQGGCAGRRLPARCLRAARNRARRVRRGQSADGKYVTVGAIEPQFYALLLEGLGLRADQLPNQLDRAAFPDMHRIFAERFANKTRDEWTAISAGTDACVTPRPHLDGGGTGRAPAGAVDAGAVQRCRPGRSGATVLPHPLRSDRRAPSDHNTHRRHRLVAKVSCRFFCEWPRS